MDQLEAINLLDFALSLSETLDLASALLAQHQLRTAYLTWRIGKEIQLPSSVLSKIVFAALLHDIGALTPEEKIDLHEDNYNKNIDLHCKYGECILKQAKIFEEAAKVIRYHHTEWQEWGQLKATDLAICSQVVFLADTVERKIDRNEFILHQNESIWDEICKLTGTSFHPEIVEAFEALASQEEFWLGCVSPSLVQDLRENAPGHQEKINPKEFLDISKVVRKIIDFRSNFTATHSTGVSSAAALLAEKIGYTKNEMEMMQFAGNMHDVGKLALSNRVLEKPGKLTRREYALIKQHTYHTCSFLRRCGLPECLVAWAGYHHEKINGSGYPYHLAGNEISTGARIVAVADVLIALAENRPYRDGLKKKKVLSILKEMVNSEHLDGELVQILETRYDEIVEPTLQKQKVAATVFTTEMELMAN